MAEESKVETIVTNIEYDLDETDPPGDKALWFTFTEYGRKFTWVLDLSSTKELSRHIRELADSEDAPDYNEKNPLVIDLTKHQRYICADVIGEFADILPYIHRCDLDDNAYWIIKGDTFSRFKCEYAFQMHYIFHYLCARIKFDNYLFVECIKKISKMQYNKSLVVQTYAILKECQIFENFKDLIQEIAEYIDHWYMETFLRRIDPPFDVSAMVKQILIDKITDLQNRENEERQRRWGTNAILGFGAPANTITPAPQGAFNFGTGGGGFIAPTGPSAPPTGPTGPTAGGFA